MFKIISKNRATNISQHVKGTGFETREAAEKFAVRLTMAESNPKVTYEVL
jgi:hypothetical protein